MLRMIWKGLAAVALGAAMIPASGQSRDHGHQDHHSGPVQHTTVTHTRTQTRTRTTTQHWRGSTYSRSNNWNSQHSRGNSWDRGGAGIYNDRFRDRTFITVGPREYHDSGWWRDHRGYVDNEWSTIAIGAGLVGALGLLDGDDTLFFAGTAGALYAVDRYDHDIYSSDRRLHLRALYFQQPGFWRDGVYFERRSIWRRGIEYYQFIRL